MKHLIVAVFFSVASGTPALSFDEGTFTGQQIVQTKLNELGYDVGKPDGVPGKRTMTGIQMDAKKKGYEASVSGFQDYYISETVKGSKPLDNIDLQASIKEKMHGVLLDPYSAEYMDWTLLPSGNICVKINAKNSLGAYTGYKEWHVKVNYITTLLGGAPSPLEPNPNENINFWRCVMDG